MNLIQTYKRSAEVKYRALKRNVSIYAKIVAKRFKSKSIFSSLDTPYTPVRRLEFDDLIQARQFALDPYFPNRYLLIEFYNSIVKDDAHLKAVMRKFKNNILNKKYKIIDRRTGEIDLEKTALLKKSWFYRFLNYYAESYSFGFSALNFIPKEDNSNGVNFKIELIDRRHVSPEGEFIRKRVFEQTGVSFEELNSEGTGFNIFQINLPDNDFGLLDTVCMLATYIRHSWGNWTAAMQLMTTFIRVVKTSDFHNPESRALLSNFLEKMGKLAHIVIPQDTDIEIKETSRSDFHKVPKELIVLANELATKLYLAGTMTMDNGSSKAQGNVHQDSEDAGTTAIKQELLFTINDELLPFMSERFGFEIDPQQYEFVWDDEPELSIVVWFDKVGKYLLDYIDKDFLEQKLNIKLRDDFGQPQAAPTQMEGLKKKASSVLAKINELYFDRHSHFVAENFETPDNGNIIDDIIESIFDDQGTATLSEELINKLVNSYAEKLEEAIDEGFGEPDFDTEDAEFLEALKENARVFSRAKAESQIIEITNLLTNEEGALRTFSEFKELALDLHDTFNSTWLKTEYNTAIAGSQAARKWRDIQNNAEALPLLKYTTIGDSNVRDEHKKLDGIILPVNHSFWYSHYPPNGFACRCTVQQLADGEQTTQMDLINLKIEDLDPTFNNNIGITKQLFTNSHPYFNQ